MPLLGHWNTSRRISGIVLLLAASAMGRPAVCTAQVRDSAAVVTTIVALERSWASAMVGSDTARLRRFVAPHFAATTTTAATSVTAPRAQWLAAITRERVSAFDTRDMSVRVFARRPPWHVWPDMAIGSYFVTRRVGSAGGATTETLFISDVWRFTGVEWLAVARYQTVQSVSRTAGAPP